MKSPGHHPGLVSFDENQPTRMLALVMLFWHYLPINATPAEGEHPFYFSLAEIQYDAQDGTLEVAVKMFTDDLEQALAARYQQPLHLGLSDQHPDAEVYLALYLKEQLNLRSQERDLEQRYLGQEQEADVTWCYVEIDLPEPPGTLWIRNALLTDQFAAQRNLVHVRVGDQTESILLQRGKLSDEVSFQ